MMWSSRCESVINVYHISNPNGQRQPWYADKTNAWPKWYYVLEPTRSLLEKVMQANHPVIGTTFKMAYGSPTSCVRLNPRIIDWLRQSGVRDGSEPTSVTVRA